MCEIKQVTRWSMLRVGERDSAVILAGRCSEFTPHISGFSTLLDH